MYWLYYFGSAVVHEWTSSYGGGAFLPLVACRGSLDVGLRPGVEPVLSIFTDSKQTLCVSRPMFGGSKYGSVPHMCASEALTSLAVSVLPPILRVGVGGRSTVGLSAVRQ